MPEPAMDRRDTAAGERSRWLQGLPLLGIAFHPPGKPRPRRRGGFCHAGRDSFSVWIDTTALAIGRADYRARLR
jgi:hypothetical protein